MLTFLSIVALIGIGAAVLFVRLYLQVVRSVVHTVRYSLQALYGARWS